MTVKKLGVFFVSIFLVFSVAMDIRAEEELQKKAQEGSGLSGLQEKIEKLEKDIEELKKETETRRKEAEARGKLEVTEEEKAEKEKGILAAADRRYTLPRRRTLGLEYNFRYSYYSVDQVTSIAIEHQKEHTLNHTLVADYALLDNLTITGALPFVYKYETLMTVPVTKQDENG